MNEKLMAGDWLWLTGEGKELCLLEYGRVELYVVRKENGEFGTRHFLEELNGLTLLPCLDKGEEIALLLIALEETSVCSLDWEKVLAHPQREKLLDSLVEILLLSPRSGIAPRGARNLICGGVPTVVEEESVLAPMGMRAVWVKIVRGSAKLPNGAQAFQVTILAGYDYLRTVTELEYCAYTSAEAVNTFPKEILLQIVLPIWQHFCRIYTEYYAAEDKKYQGRMSDNVRRQEILRRSAYEGLLANLLSEKNLVAEPDDTSQPPVISALRLIADHLGVERSGIKMPREEMNGADDETIIDQVLRSSELFGRRVRLEPGWMQHDQGPLLVFKEGRPLAALPKGPNKYVLADPVTRESRTADPSLDLNCEEMAFAFFRRLPDDVDSLWGWMRWAAKLCWSSDYAILFFSCLIIGILPLATPLITQTVFSDIIPSFDRQAHVMVVQVMLVTLLGSSLTSLVRGVSLLRMKNHIRSVAEPALWIKLLGLPTSFFRRYAIGDLAMRMQGVASFATQCTGVVSGGLFNGVLGIFNLALMLWYSPKLTMLACFVWLIYGLLTVFFSRRLIAYQRQQIEASGIVSGFLLQLVRGLNKFRLRAAENRGFYLWSRLFGKEWSCKTKMIWQTNWLELLSTAQPVVLNFLIFFYTMVLFDESKLSAQVFMTQASFLSFNAAMGSFGASVSGFIQSIIGLLKLIPDLERLRPVLQETPEATSDKSPAGDLTGEIDFSDVSFRYRPGLPLVLKNISLHIPAGCFVAVVGGSGCGKSTLLRLLLGLEKPEHGVIQFDGQDLAELDVTSVRRQMGVVMQQGRLMAGSILENIIGSLPLTVDDAWEAAEQVGLAEDIRRMPMGMFTFISENGSNISGGQKQRILVARAIVGRARIIVFDEATRAMDNATQAIVSQTVASLHATRIIVAHRLSTIRNADKIVVLDKGNVAEVGTFDELVTQGGIFTKLVERQVL